MRNVLKIVIVLCFFIVGLTAAGTVEAKSVGVSLQLTSGSSDAEVSLVSAAAITCDHTIGLKVSKANGRENYAQVQPGDTVCIEAGVRDSLTLRNFTGTAQEPITFINSGGQVVIDTQGWSGIQVENSSFFHLTGTGAEGIKYGFYITASDFGVKIGWKSTDFEVDHIETENIPGGVGISTKTMPTCPDGSTNDYDYDGDGKIKGDLDDVITQDNFVQRNTTLHDIYVHDTGRSGFYIGGPHYDEGETKQCNSGQERLYPITLKGVDIYNNIVDAPGRKGIQVKAAVADCQIHHNEIYHDSWLNVTGHKGGILNAPGSTCHIFNNWIENGGSQGIVIQGLGGNKIYNNVIVNPGQIDPNSGRGIRILSGIASNDPIFVWNNTIINPTADGIKFSYSQGEVKNNIITSPGGQYIDTVNGVTVSSNLKQSSTAQVGFVNPDTHDYSLKSDSPAVDSGLNLNSEDIIVDFAGIARPQGTTYDIGAYELSTNDAPPTIPSDPYLNIQSIQTEVFPGDTVEVSVGIKNSKDLYGLQVTCSVDPAVLSWQNADFDNFFSDPLIGAKTMDVAAGSWTGAISQKNPAPALSGDGDFATLTFEAVAPGTTTVTCEPLASDRDGFQLPMSTSDDSITVLDTTNVEGSLEGMITYQGRNEHSGIAVMATGPVIRSVQAQSSGQFQIDALKDGDYDIKADTELYLPSCAIVTVGNGQIATLTAAVLAGGDSDDDDEIKINDATLIGSNFGLSASSTPAMDPRADINADGEVNIKDLSILGGNFGKQGCQEWSVTSITDTSS